MLDLNTTLKQTGTEKDVARIVHSNLEDRHKIDAIMDLVEREVKRALEGQTDKLKDHWGFNGGTRTRQ